MVKKREWLSGVKCDEDVLTVVTTNHGKSLLGSRQQELKLYASG